MADVKRVFCLRAGGIAHIAHAFAAASVIVVASAASALTPAELVGPDLQAQSVTVAGLRGDRLVYFDDQRRLRNESTGQFVQLRNIGGDRPPAPADEAAPASVLELTDGQRFVGRLAPPAAAEAGAAGESLVHWETPELGVIGVALERIARIDLAAPARPGVGPSAPASDTVTLTNGDVLIGFIAGVSEVSIEITPDQGPTMTLPLERVAAVRLVNPALPPGQVDPRERLVSLRAGGRIRVMDLELAAERLTFRLPLSVEPQQRRSLPLEAVERIEFTGSGWRLADLVDQPMSVTAGGDVFGLPMPPRIEGGGLFLHAPVTVSFDLPPQARRFAAAARLDVPQTTPSEAADWADLEIVVHREQAADRFHLGASEPTAAINVSVAGSALRLELDAGINGPIMDRVRLDDAVLLLRLPVQESPDSAR